MRAAKKAMDIDRRRVFIAASFAARQVAEDHNLNFLANVTDKNYNLVVRSSTPIPRISLEIGVVSGLPNHYLKSRMNGLLDIKSWDL